MKEIEKMEQFVPDDVESIVNGAVRSREESDREESRNRERSARRESERRSAWRRAMGSTLLFASAGAAVIGGMLAGLINPIFALPLAVVYFMRAAVRYDRWVRKYGV